MIYEELKERDLLGKRRNKFDIIEDLLTVANKSKGVSKTLLVYQTNLNFRRIDDFLLYLMERGLIERMNEQGQRFATTMKGRECLLRLSFLKELI